MLWPQHMGFFFILQNKQTNKQQQQQHLVLRHRWFETCSLGCLIHKLVWPRHTVLHQFPLPLSALQLLFQSDNQSINQSISQIHLYCLSSWSTIMQCSYKKQLDSKKVLAIQNICPLDIKFEIPILNHNLLSFSKTFFFLSVLVIKKCFKINFIEIQIPHNKVHWFTVYGLMNFDNEYPC